MTADPLGREADVQGWLAQMPDHIVHRFHAAPGSDELVVSVATAKKFAFEDLAYRQNVLFLVDRQGSYFTFKASLVGKTLRGIARSFRKVTFLGSSKAGFGALLLAGLCAQGDPKKTYYCLAFSPQTHLYPPNPNLINIPSYTGLLSLMDRTAGFKISVERFGSLEFLKKLPNLTATIVYSEGHGRDKVEAERLFAPNIRKYPVPFVLHKSTLPFTQRRKSRAAIAAQIDALRGRPSDDPETVRARQFDRNELVDMLALNNWVPSLEQLLDEASGSR